MSTVDATFYNDKGLAFYFKLKLCNKDKDWKQSEHLGQRILIHTYTMYYSHILEIIIFCRQCMRKSVAPSEDKNKADGKLAHSPSPQKKLLFPLYTFCIFLLSLKGLKGTANQCTSMFSVTRDNILFIYRKEQCSGAVTGRKGSRGRRPLKKIPRVHK